MQRIQTASQGVGVWYQKRFNATRPFALCHLVCFAVETICGRYAETSWSVGQCTMVFQKIPIIKRKRVSTREAVYSAAPTSVCLFMHGPNMPSVCLGVTGGGGGRNSGGYPEYCRPPVYTPGVFCFHMPFLRPCAAVQCTCTSTCGDMQLYDNFGSSKVVA